MYMLKLIYFNVILNPVIKMKEKIYTIPVNEAFEESDGCPLCYLRKKLEKEAVDYALGAAMMEPDYRIVSNEKGYCNRHFSMMLPKKEKLSLALVLETHMDEVQKKLDSLKNELDEIKLEKKSLFKKKNTASASHMADMISQIASSCVICDKLSSTMERFISVLFYLWGKDEKFKDKLINSKGFCLHHLSDITEGAFKYLGKEKAENFLEIIYEKENNELKTLRDEVHKFTLKFDYRNAGQKWGSEIDAPKRCIEKLSSYVLEE